ncbi:MAG: hypothetical protein HW405_470 [Candidatus Berkelbacteria bacterium]|nr:hypothetical protein [Candidatus Berkelbacteria bacterium]
MTKKTVNLILLFVVVLTMVLPIDVSAANPPQKYYRMYKRQLNEFLINWRTNAPGTCVRTTQQPDGTSSSCLSMAKINKIMSQLDRDKYFDLDEALTRRYYLMNTGEQPYVMKKVVMYFEQVLNPNTIVYGYTLNSADNYKITDAVLSAWSSLQGKEPYRAGDSQLIALALNKVRVASIEPIYAYSPKAKSEISRWPLGDIYLTSRFATFGAFQNPDVYPNWTPDELAALQAVADLNNVVINYAIAHKVSPLQAKMTTDAQRSISVAIGFMGAPARGGAALVKGAAPFATGRTLAIGSKSVVLESKVLANMYSNTDLCTHPGMVDSSIGQIESATQTLSRAYKGYFPGIDDVLANGVRKTRILEMVDPGNPHILATADREFGLRFGDAVFTRGAKYKEPVIHEYVHWVRYHTENLYGITERWWHFDETMTSWTAVKAAQKSGIRTIANAHIDATGYPSRRFMNDIIDIISQERGITNAQAEDYLLRIQFSGRYSAIGESIGRPTFVADLDGMLARYDTYSHYLKACSSAGCKKEWMGDLLKLSGDIQTYIKTGVMPT